MGEGDWRVCTKCRELTYAADGMPGPCPGGGDHVHAPHGYSLTSAIDPPDGDEGIVWPPPAKWRLCATCRALVRTTPHDPSSIVIFDPAPGTQCPSDNGWHDLPWGTYYIPGPTAAPGTVRVPGWRSCKKCLTLVDPTGASGACRAGGSHELEDAEAFELSRQAGPSDLLLVRPDDLLILSLRWSGFSLSPTGGGRAELTGTGAAPLLAVAFPPQSIAEEKIPESSSSGWSARGRLARPSRVTFGFSPSTRIPLSVEGVLAAMAGPDAKVVGARTSIELPWRLPVTPAAAAGGDVVSEHTRRPLASPSGTVGLWHARLRSRDGGDGDAGLELEPLPVDPDDEGLDVGPLNGSHRQAIRDVLPRRARARRLELSALGGSLSASLSTPDVDWDHDATLGRDHAVRVVLRGVLYPFGHRAVLTEVADRVLQPDGSPAVAGLKRTVRLAISEPVRAIDQDDGPLRRRFPFDEVELLTPTVASLASASFASIKREAVGDGPLSEEREALKEQRREPADRVQATIAGLPWDVWGYIEQGRGSAGAYQEAQAILHATANPDALREEQRQIDDELTRLYKQGADQATIDEVRGRRPSDEYIGGVQREYDQALGAVEGLWAAVEQEFGSLARTIQELANQGDADAQQVVKIDARVAELTATIDAIAAEPDHPLWWIPTTTEQQPVRFPVRCAGSLGDVFFDVPLVFVRDFELAEAPYLPAFHSLTDPRATAAVSQAWASHATVEIPAARIDMVRADRAGARPGVTFAAAPNPLPGDVHEVHSMTLFAARTAGELVPQLSQFTAELPALRALLPDIPRPALTFADEFLDQPGIPGAPLVLSTAEGISSAVGVDFTDVADRAGALVSPKFMADRISRELGPVAADALPDLDGFDPRSAFEGATLLGFPLSSLIKLPVDPAEPLPKPPAIVSLLENGVPQGMTMSWTLPLVEHGPFRPSADSKLVLTVEISRARRETTCKVNDFRLVLPPGGSGDGLLTLTFASLEFTQTEGRPPDLKVGKLRVGFGGALKLLQELQEELDSVISLPDNRPRVDVRENGLTASYALSVPSVTAGAFNLRNITMRTAVDVPFVRDPVTVGLSFATRANPFTVSVLTFGGSGYLDLTLGPEGLTRLEASIEFGAMVAVDFVVARGEVHALGGVRFVQNGGAIQIDGFVSIGGSVEVLGLVSVSINLLVTLSYREPNRLLGRATIVIEIDVTLFSRSVEIDSGEWVLAGSEAHPASRRLGPSPTFREPGDPLAEWKRYREAFAG